MSSAEEFFLREALFLLVLVHSVTFSTPKIRTIIVSRRQFPSRNNRRDMVAGNRISTVPPLLDEWLPRVSHIAQVLLAVVTLGSLYYTVLPLYQKAVLEEAIARKEVELKAATASLDQKYRTLRDFSVRDYVIGVNEECSGFVNRSVDELQNAKFTDRTFTLDVQECLLRREGQTFALAELRSADRVFFRDSLARLGLQLKATQLKYREAFDRAPAEVTPDNIEILIPPSNVVGRSLEVVSKLLTAEQVKLLKRDAAIRELQNQQILAYRSEFFALLAGLAKLQWPTHPD